MSSTPLPGGTVTFLFTDIAGSTRLWDQEPVATHHAVARHDEIFEALVEAHHGVVVRPRGEGDSRFAVFPRASDAVAAASAIQQAFVSESWQTSTPLLVRMALHTGEAALRGGDYYGSVVNRCARLRGMAHGGQVLLSLATMQLVRDALPPDVSIRDLGEHTLRDLTDREHVFQLVIPGVPSDFPPLVSPGRRLNNLPAQATTFVGREREIEAVRARLLDPAARLVTLVGPGGAGKTRLSLHVSETLLDAFEDGVVFVQLASITEPELVIPAIAQTLGVREVGGQGIVSALTEHIGQQHLLLVLDNVEQLIDASPRIADLLTTCPNLKLLMTSREAVPLRGSREIYVPPLDLPDFTPLPPLERLMSYAAVRLFVERARDVKASFELTEENAAAVVEVCHRLDGLPLAIELAAARVRIFTPQALLARLEHRLPLLTGGARDLPERQQTLRGAIAWSHDLLDEHDRVIFRRLAVFSGGFTFDAAEAVVQLSDGDATVSLDVFTGVDSLVAKSLLTVPAATDDLDEPRFRMLQTIREFGLEQLDAHGEQTSVRQRHAEVYLALAEAAAPELAGNLQASWLERLETEHDNLRGALDWSLQPQHAEPDTALRLAGALWPFWDLRGYLQEGRRWLEMALSRPDGDAWRANALTGAGTMAWSQGDYASAARFHTEALDLYARLGDTRGVAFATNNLGVQAVAIGDFDRARSLFEESLALYRSDRCDAGVADELSNLGALAQYKGDLERAASLAEESLALRRHLGDQRGIADGLYNLGEIAYAQADFPRAASLYQESLAIRNEIGERSSVVHCVAALAAVAVEQGQLDRAATLCGAAHTLLETTGITLDETERARFERIADRIRSEIGDHERATYWSRGKDMPFDLVVRYALANDTPDDYSTGEPEGNIDTSLRMERSSSHDEPHRTPIGLAHRYTTTLSYDA